MIAENSNPKKRVLIVEDDDMLGEIYRKKFGGAGFDLILEKSGKDALGKAKELHPDLVLLDLMMPEMDGFQVLEAIKKDPAIKDTKVVIASNISQTDDKEKAMQLGAKDFLVKSDFDLNQLAERIESYLK